VESGTSDHPSIIQVVGGSRLRRADLSRYAQDSIGRFALANAAVVLAPETGPVTADIRLAYRCAGFLALRRRRELSGSWGASSRMEAIASPGMKVRVVGVPDALTFIEGDWIRRSCPMLAPGHWVVSAGPAGQPSGLTAASGRQFVSVDLKAATDGLSHGAVRAVIDGLSLGGCIRPADVPLALRGLGLEPRTKWTWEGSTWYAARGSPMGTPLSFVVLSWVNAWATSAFSDARHHGDDAVGRARWSFEIDEYAAGVAAVGGELNRAKTFTSSSGWTMCEVAAWPRQNTKYGRAVFVPPPCPPPGLQAPVAADPRCGDRGLRRQERVMKTLFPWCRRDPRLRLPLEVGGLGYTGRGLAVPRSVRRLLGTLVSRGVDWAVARGVVGKAPFREEGLYPRPLVPEPSRPRSYHAARRLVAQDPLEDPSGVPVPLRSLVVFEAMLVESQYRLLEGDRFRRRWGGDRPARTKSKALFRPLVGRLAPPLSRERGVSAIRRWAAMLSGMTVRVFEDVASEIRDRIPDPAQA
jgi:hypothetical protein